MSKSGVSHQEGDKKKDEDGRGDSNNNNDDGDNIKPPVLVPEVVPDVPTRLTRNRLLLHQRQKNSPSSSARPPGDPKQPGKGNNNATAANDSVVTVKQTKAPEDVVVKEGPSSSSLGNNEKEGPIKKTPNPSQTEQPDKSKMKAETTTVPPPTIMKPRRGKDRKTKAKQPANPAGEDKNGISEKNVLLPMKTRSTRSCNQPKPVVVADVSASNQQKEGDENVLVKNVVKKPKRANPLNRKTAKRRLYDEAGALITNGKDYCDCLETDCPGCHFPCKKCGSEKCGTECRCDRTWVYDEVKVEGTGITVKNHAC